MRFTVSKRKLSLRSHFLGLALLHDVHGCRPATCSQCILPPPHPPECHRHRPSLPFPPARSTPTCPKELNVILRCRVLLKIGRHGELILCLPVLLAHGPHLIPTARVRRLTVRHVFTSIRWMTNTRHQLPTMRLFQTREGSCTSTAPFI